MDRIENIAALEALYESAVPRSLTKVVDHVTPLYRRWIETARFCVLSTVGPAGTDASPRGDDGPVVRLSDPQTLLMPDWRGNNRLDTLRNIVADGRVSLMFMVSGSNTVVRVNGHAILTTDEDLIQSFEQRCKHPKTVLVITIAELYFQCAKALMRADLWARSDAAELPTAGQFLKEREAGFEANAYDETYVDYAQPRMW